MAPIVPFGFAGILVPCNGDSSPNSTGFTLFMPQVSVENIGHLAVDLVISILSILFYNQPPSDEEPFPNTQLPMMQLHAIPSRSCHCHQRAEISTATPLPF
uniref:Uncharacterized protein n=1 Tax=Meleagris gallopavo TaxID=9103 RepID=A0A803YPS9_MELGA